MMDAIYLRNGPKVRHGMRSASFEAVRVSGQRAGLEKLAEGDRGAAKLSDGAYAATTRLALFGQQEANQR